jgi:hypothetical protein
MTSRLKLLGFEHKWLIDNFYRDRKYRKKDAEMIPRRIRFAYERAPYLISA